MLAKKKPASELLGVLKNESNKNLSLLKVTLKQVDALKKANEKPDLYLTD